MMNDSNDKVMSYAGVWARFAALLIDSIVITGAIGLVAVLLLDVSMTSYMIFLILLVLGQWLYFALMESSSGATLGKRMMGITVVDLEGSPISFGRASGRYFAKCLSGILLIGYIMAFFTEKKQALHDLLAGTLVLDGNLVPQVSSQELPLAPDEEAGPINLEIVPETKPIDPTLETFGTPAESPFHRDTFSKPPAPKPADPGKKNPAAPASARTCPSCGNGVGLYQTKCHRCSAKLKKGGF
jgi:uncharacterized RDD family membrane protein YckC